MASVDIIARGIAASALAGANLANSRLDVLQNGMKYMGAVPYFKDLPNDANVGDVYTVKFSGSSGSIPDGREYVWGPYEGSNQWVSIGPDGTNRAFPASWPTTSATTTKAFCDVVNSDSQAIQGTSFLGEVRWSDLPNGLVNAEVIVEIMAGTGISGKVIHLVLSSGNRAPYRWEYTYWGNGSYTSGWIGFQPELVAGSNISISGNVISATVASIPECPTSADGVFIPRATVLNGQVTYTWIPDTGVYTTET